MRHGFHFMQPGIHCSMLHGFHCMQPGYITPRCMQSSAFNLDPLCYAAMNPLHSIGIHLAKLHVIHCIHSGWISQCCIEYGAFNHTAWNPCIQSISITPRCMESTSFNRDTMHHSALNPLHSIGMHLVSLHGLHRIKSGSIAQQCMEYSAFNDAALNPLHSIGMLWAILHKLHCIQ